MRQGLTHKAIMSTRHLIAIENQNNTVDVIYSHWDGDPKHNGKILYEHFSDRDKLKELIALGNIARLFPRLHPIGKHHFKSPEEETTVAYHRDRGDVWESEDPKACPAKPITFRSVQKFLNTFTDYYHPTVEYIYVFTKDDQWEVYTAVGYPCPGNLIKEKHNLAAILRKGKPHDR